MAAKDVRNLILALIILIIGIFLLTRIGKNFTSNLALPSSVPNIVTVIDSVSTLLTLGLGVLVIILMPFYLSKRSQEKKLRQQYRQTVQPQQPDQQKKK
ncbi:hypothetical protein HY501_02610 [Candidatus Woesearchaeota archaeon]|nr:hypothetical protein [Candidatus Woesearchaeota archaeon]